MKFTDILTNSAHAYIVEGRQGEVRSEFIQKLVKGLNCQSADAADRPCNECESCRQIDAGTSMDVFHMEKSGKTAYLVNDAIAFIERIGMGSYGRHVVGIIDEADLLSETIQNKLLKTLEEPEDGAVIILATSNKDNLLQTVRSRCNSIRLSDFADDEDAESREQIVKAAESFLTETQFYKVRDLIDKKLKTTEDAIEMLGLIEDTCRDRMIESGEMAMADAIDLIETARADIYRGMNYSKALRRLYLELA